MNILKILFSFLCVSCANPVSIQYDCVLLRSERGDLAVYFDVPRSAKFYSDKDHELYSTDQFVIEYEHVRCK